MALMMNSPEHGTGTFVEAHSFHKSACSMALMMNSPEHGTGTFVEAMSSVEMEMIDESHMRVEYPKELVDGIQEWCDRSDIGGLFKLVEEEEFVCDILSVMVNLKLINMASCYADTEECRSMDPALVFTDIWDSMGLKCQEKAR